MVLDGRDIGTAVFPDAEVKFFLDASSGRARPAPTPGAEVGRLRHRVSRTVEEDVRERDYTDTHRVESPLERAWDALELDTTRPERR